MYAIEYELSEDDLVEFGVMSLRASRHFSKILKATVVLGCSLIIAIAMLLLLVGREQWPAWLLLVLGLPSIVLAVPPLVWRRMPRVIRRRMRTGRNTALLGPQKLELHDDCVRRAHQEAESKLTWKSVERLLCSRNFLALYISTAQAFVVPRRAFATPNAEAEFRSRAEQLSGHRFIETPY